MVRSATILSCKLTDCGIGEFGLHVQEHYLPKPLNRAVLFPLISGSACLVGCMRLTDLILLDGAAADATVHCEFMQYRHGSSRGAVKRVRKWETGRKSERGLLYSDSNLRSP
jgi:hypothetical protein